MNRGWIKVYRKLLDSPLWRFDPLCFKAFYYLVLSANHKANKVYISNLKSEVTVGRGELITSYSNWAREITYRDGNKLVTPTESQMRTILKKLEACEMVTRVSTEGCLWLRIENYDLYQSDKEASTGVATGLRHGNDTAVTGQRHGSDTEQEWKNGRMEEWKKKETPLTPQGELLEGSDQGKNKYKEVRERIIAHLNTLAGTNYQPHAKSIRRYLDARLDDGLSEKEALEIIEMMVEEWSGTEHEKYLRPETLFNATKCESYRGRLPLWRKQKAQPRRPDHPDMV